MSYAKTLRRGDLVEVKGPDEILKTLDSDGALDHVPFMPEMLEFCGRRFRVSRRVVKSCSSGSRSSMRGFRTDDVVLLELRCSGLAHDGCQKRCMIFWREAWLRKVQDQDPVSDVSEAGIRRLGARLKTMTAPSRYFCQASELLKATEPLTRWQKVGKCFSDIRAGNCGTLEMVRRLATGLFWKSRKKLVGEYARGTCSSTPTESLKLQVGDWVDVKPIETIITTLNDVGHNRGLYFSPDMRLLCGTRQQVARRLDKIIVDGTGEMRPMHNTVCLENSLCGCEHVAVGGCSRDEFTYWREIWLRRPSDSSS